MASNWSRLQISSQALAVYGKSFLHKTVDCTYNYVKYSAIMGASVGVLCSLLGDYKLTNETNKKYKVGLARYFFDRYVAPVCAGVVVVLATPLLFLSSSKSFTCNHIVNLDDDGSPILDTSYSAEFQTLLSYQSKEASEEIIDTKEDKDKQEEYIATDYKEETDAKSIESALNIEF